ncbi:BnaA09g15050D [Brassica napus]|uniref:BnaA09g15050D protein n=1 Tax=Brassica napus TaxID=3708 RepID=A0A078HT30_BRANA|nr:BnaA09g15050D [Brassica napus]
MMRPWKYLLLSFLFEKERLIFSSYLLRFGLIDLPPPPTADELVQMIAHFYYKAKRPSWIDKANVTPYC